MAGVLVGNGVSYLPPRPPGIFFGGSSPARAGGRAGGGRLHDAAAMLSHGLLWTLAFAVVIGAAVLA